MNVNANTDFIILFSFRPAGEEMKMVNHLAL